MRPVADAIVTAAVGCEVLGIVNLGACVGLWFWFVFGGGGTQSRRSGACGDLVGSMVVLLEGLNDEQPAI